MATYGQGLGELSAHDQVRTLLSAWSTSHICMALEDGRVFVFSCIARVAMV